jgi:hypothetical protein
MQPRIAPCECADFLDSRFLSGFGMRTGVSPLLVVVRQEPTDDVVRVVRIFEVRELASVEGVE